MKVKLILLFVLYFGFSSFASAQNSYIFQVENHSSKVSVEFSIELYYTVSENGILVEKVFKGGKTLKTNETYRTDFPCYEVMHADFKARYGTAADGTPVLAARLTPTRGYWTQRVDWLGPVYFTATYSTAPQGLQVILNAHDIPN